MPPLGEYLLGFLSLCSELLIDGNSISSLILSPHCKLLFTSNFIADKSPRCSTVSRDLWLEAT